MHEKCVKKASESDVHIKVSVRICECGVIENGELVEKSGYEDQEATFVPQKTFFFHQPRL